MLIRNVRGKNVGNYDLFEYDFTKGTTIIEGNNKSGKSTILDLVRFATYGNCIKAGKIEYFKKRGAKGPFETTITFEGYKGSTWIVFRKYEAKKSIAVVYVNGIEKASGTEAVDLYIKDNFVAESLLFNSNIVQQKDSSSFVDIRPAERFKLCLDLFGIDEFKKKATVVSQDISKNETSVSQIQSEISANKIAIATAEGRLRTLDKDKLNSEITTIQKSIDEKTIIKEANELTLKDLSKKLTEADEHNKGVSEHNKRIAAINSEIASAKKTVIDITDGISDLKLSEEHNLKKIQVQTEQQAGYEKELSEIKLHRISNFNQDDLDAAYRELTEISNRKSELDKSIKLVSAGMCPTCGQPTTNAFGGLDDLSKQLDSVTTQLTESQNKISALKTKKENIEKLERENIGAKERKVTMETRIEGVKNSINAIHLSIESGKKQIANLNELLESSMTKVSLKEEEFKSLTLQETIDTSVIKASITNTSKTLQELNIDIRTLSQKLIETKSSFGMIDTLIQDVAQYKLIIEEKEKSMVSIQDEINTLSQVKELFDKKVPLFMIMKKLDYIAFEANKFLHSVTDKFDIKFEQSGDKLLIVFYDNYTGLPSDFKNLSGMESGIGSLAVRMGLSMYNAFMNNTPVHFMVLDEIDEAFSVENTKLLFDSLNNLKSQFQQMILVSHKPEIKEWLQPDHVISVKNTGFNSYIDKE
jgi:DNA repair exonuclease SbcCD ATPase subunit